MKPTSEVTCLDIRKLEFLNGVRTVLQLHYPPVNISLPRLRDCLEPPTKFSSTPFPVNIDAKVQGVVGVAETVAVIDSEVNLEVGIIYALDIFSDHKRATGNVGRRLRLWVLGIHVFRSFDITDANSGRDAGDAFRFGHLVSRRLPREPECGGLAVGRGKCRSCEPGLDRSRKNSQPSQLGP